MKLDATTIDVLKKFIRKFEANYVLFEEGERGFTFFLILQGEIRLTKAVSVKGKKQDMELRVLGKGEFLGEMAIFGGKARSATATTLSPCHLVVLTKPDLEAVINAKPQFAMKLLEIISLRLADTNDKLVKATAQIIPEEESLYKDALDEENAVETPTAQEGRPAGEETKNMVSREEIAAAGDRQIKAASPSEPIPAVNGESGES